MNYRIPTMPKADRELRRQHIIDLATAGNPPSIIARHVGLTTDYVRQVILDAGVREANPLSIGREANAMWEMDEDKRREAIIKRSAEGARRTRRERRDPEIDHLRG